MDAKTCDWGLEIETIVPEATLRNENMRIGPYHGGIQVPYLPTGWKAEHDGSIQTRPGFASCDYAEYLFMWSNCVLCNDNRGSQISNSA